MDIRIMEYMKAIEEEGSISKAAERVHISQSALSQSLAKLEQELGTPLFERRDKRWVPTEAGDLYLRGATTMITIKEEAYRRINALSVKRSYTLSLAICPQVFMLYGNSMFSALRSGLPDIHLNVFRTASTQALEQLKSGVVDMAIYSELPLEGRAPSGELLYKEELLLSVPISRAWDGDTIDPERISMSPLIIPVEGSHMGDLVYPLIRSFHIDPESCYTADSSSGVDLLLQNGYGSAFLPGRILNREGYDGFISYHADPPLAYDIRFMAGKHFKDEKTAADILRLIRELVAPSGSV